MKNLNLNSKELNSDLVIVALIFTLLISAVPYIQTKLDYNIKSKKLNQLNTNYQVAKKVIVELDGEVKELKSKLSALQKDLEEVEVLIQIKEELRGYSIREKAQALGIGFSESNWNFNAEHTGRRNYRNFCGNMPWYWDDFLIEKNVNPKGPAACVEIYKFYKNKHGTRYKALKSYKGINKNTHIIIKTEKMIDKAYEILKNKG